MEDGLEQLPPSDFPPVPVEARDYDEMEAALRRVELKLAAIKRDFG